MRHDYGDGMDRWSRISNEDFLFGSSSNKVFHTPGLSFISGR